MTPSRATIGLGVAAVWFVGVLAIGPTGDLTGEASRMLAIFGAAVVLWVTEAIPLAARIVAVADAFDALTAGRPHKRALTLSDATAELRKVSGRMLDPACVDALLKQFGRVREIHQRFRDDADTR